MRQNQKLNAVAGLIFQENYLRNGAIPDSMTITKTASQNFKDHVNYEEKISKNLQYDYSLSAEVSNAAAQVISNLKASHGNDPHSREEDDALKIAQQHCNALSKAPLTEHPHEKIQTNVSFLKSHEDINHIQDHFIRHGSLPSAEHLEHIKHISQLKVSHLMEEFAKQQNEQNIQQQRQINISHGMDR